MDSDFPKVPNTRPGAPTSGRRGRPSHGKHSKFKICIDKVIGHKCDKHGVRFEVSWVGSDCITYEKAHVVDAKGGYNDLFEYLQDLNLKHELRFVNMMIREPGLCEYLREKPEHTGDTEVE